MKKLLVLVFAMLMLSLTSFPQEKQTVKKDTTKVKTEMVKPPVNTVKKDTTKVFKQVNVVKKDTTKCDTTKVKKPIKK